MPEPAKILFVCAHNAGRSPMAAAFLDQLTDGAVQVRSAGPDPGERVNPVVVEAMREVGIDLSAHAPAQLTDQTLADSDLVITTSGPDACTVLPGQRLDEWPVEDVSGKSLDEVRAIRDDIRARAERLAAQLGRDPGADPAS